jgi:hypothetical protein
VTITRPDRILGPSASTVEGCRANARSAAFAGAAAALLTAVLANTWWLFLLGALVTAGSTFDAVRYARKARRLAKHNPPISDTHSRGVPTTSEKEQQ